MIGLGLIIAIGAVIAVGYAYPRTNLVGQVLCIIVGAGVVPLSLFWLLHGVVHIYGVVLVSTLSILAWHDVTTAYTRKYETERSTTP